MDQAIAESADRAARRTRKHAESLSSSLTRTAKALERSAILAEAHALRYEQTGRSGAAAKERQVAEHARETAQRARVHAAEWLDRSVGRKQ